jgi:Zn-dependent peptidase ImmA (M78 family)
MPADRERFTLAHELGHLVMHTTTISEDAEHEADEFAAEFLMPAAEIRAQLRGIDLGTAYSLKLAWKVSMGALIRRARDLGLVSESRYKSLNVMKSKKGWHRNEPGTLDHEEPTVIKALIEVHLDEHNYTVNELADTLGLREAEFRELYDVHRAPQPHRLRLVQ